MKYGSVCSGIEAASVAWEALGWKAAWLSEIEPFPSAALANHYPSVANLGDMTKIAPYIRMGDVEAPDILVGGTPCQAFSVAGSRKGLDDARGQLTLEFVKLANAIDMRREEEHEQKCIIVWENVPGVLSSKDNAFGCFLAALAGEDVELQPPGRRWPNAGAVFGPKRAIAWRVLDAQYFGLAQRRRRVFVVASARAGFHPAQVLFEREGLRRDTPPSRGQGQEAACTLDARTEGGGFPGTDGATGGHVVAPPAWPKVFGGNNTSGPIDVAPARNACASASGRMDFESEAFIVHGTQDPCVSTDTAFALGRNNGGENAVFAIQAGALRTNPASGPDGVGVQADHAYTLEARAEVQAVAYDILGTPASEVAKCTDVHTPLRARIPGQLENSMVTMIQQSDSAVRRLTPRECERLQGFPEIRKAFTISVSFDGGADECSGHQKRCVSAATKSPRSQNNALPADESELLSSASIAAAVLSAGLASSSEPALVSVLIDSERQRLQLRSAGRLLLSVSTAEPIDWCLLPIKSGDFAQLIARINTYAAKGTIHGEAVSQPSMTCSTHRQNGSEHVQLCGRAISELVSDAVKLTSALRECLKSTTSAAGPSSLSCGLSQRTLFSCVAAVICSFIPEQIQIGNSFVLSIETVQGYTLIPWRGKPAADCPDGPRYKAIGNSKAVPVVRWIGQRIEKAINNPWSNDL